MNNKSSDLFYGSQITPFFFDSRRVKDIKEFVPRVLPFIKNKASISVLYSENDKKNYYYNDIVAQPDAVLSQNNHLISLEFKSLSGSSQKLHEKTRWQQQIRLKDVLQAIINALQVSIVEKKPCVALLRYVNVVYFIAPSKELCEFIIKKAPDAKLFYNEKRYVSSSQLCELIEPLVKKMFQIEDSQAQKNGKIAHESMLSKN